MDGPTLGYAPTTSAWSTSGAPTRWSKTRPWNSSPSQTGRHEVWKKCAESNQGASYCFTARISIITPFSMSWIRRRCLDFETSVFWGLGLWKKVCVRSFSVVVFHSCCFSRYSCLGCCQWAGLPVHNSLSLQPLRPGHALHQKPSPTRPLPRHWRSPQLFGHVRRLWQPGRVALWQR